MSDRARSVLLTLLLVVSSVSAAGVGAAQTSSPTTFHVMQDGNCHEVTPVGDGETPVEEFYDYRAGNDTLYGSYGEGSEDIQENQVSHVFVYDGAQGLSLVMLHDDLNQSEGGAITFDISGLPQDHQWMIEDDDYEGRDDNFQYDGTSAKIDWMWAPGRTDGGVVRGLGNDFSDITIDPAFGEESWAYQKRDSPWPYADDDMTWQFQSGNGEIPLDKTQSLSLSKGGCPDTTDPTAALSASPNPVANDEAVTLDASESADDEDGTGIAEYRWDFDDDGEAERTTESATVEHTYSNTGSHDASVEVVDGNDNTDTATVTVEVESADQPPTNTPTTTTSTTPTTTETTTEETTTTTTQTTTTQTTTTTTSTTTTPTTTTPTTTTTTTPTTTTTTTPTTTTTTTPDNTDPNSVLSVSPSSVGNNEEVTLDASDSTDDGGSGIDEYQWDFDDDGDFEETTESATVTHTYSGVGEHEVAVTVVDGNGNTDTATETVTVREQSSDDPPNAKLTAPDPGSMSQLLYKFDASASTDDQGVATYRWDLNSDGKTEWVDDSTTSLKPYTLFDEPGTYEATVTVVDTAGQTDTATVEYTVKKVVPDADITASSTTVEVGENVTFEATDFNEEPGTLDHICWKVGDEAGPDGTTWTTSFEQTGKKTVELVLRDRAGYENVVKKTITVTTADGGGDSGGSAPDDGSDSDDSDDSDKSNSDDSKPNESNPNDSRPDEGGLSDDDDDGNIGDGIGVADPGGDDNRNNDDAADRNSDGRTDETVSAPLNGSDGRIGSVVLHSSGDADLSVEATDAAPESVEAPTDDDGFAAVSYLTVAGADRATFTVSESRLNATDATPDDVTLFRHENGTWTAVETAQVEATDDAYRFGANVSDGTYAVGIDRPATGVADLSLGSQQVEPGQSVTVTATVENTGRAEGSHEVVLTVGGEEVSTKTVSVEAGATEEVAFSVALDSGGTYEVGVGDSTAELVVESAETTTTDEPASDGTSTQTTTASGGGVPGFGVGVTLVALVAAALVALRRS